MRVDFPLPPAPKLVAALWAALALALLSGCAPPEPLSTLPQGETGRVVRIIDGDALVLDTGLSVRLVGVEAPRPERRNRPGEPYAEQASRFLEDLAMGRRVQLVYPGLTRDRYDRALAYVKTVDNLGPELWLNLEIIRAGAARARTYPDTAALGEILFKAETQARNTKTGLWALEAYRIRQGGDMPADARGFYILTGSLGSPATSTEQDTACTRALTGSAITVLFKTGASSHCNTEPADTDLRLRGYLRDQRLEITYDLNVERLAPPPSDE